jgi:riboflavin kinase/FMN adenylyltransferase
MKDSIDNIINTTSLDALAEHNITRVVIAAGVFDGVHLGHKRLIDELMLMSVNQNAVPVAFTFFPHPRSVLAPEKAPELLLPPAKKIELLGELGVKAVVTIPFTRTFAEQSPEDFIRDTLIAGRVELCGICVGSNWRFGKNGSGTIKHLEDFANAGHFAFMAVEELLLNGELVCSTAIRRAVSSGRLADAAAMLGRNYTLSGNVIRGHHFATDKLSRPTANLQIAYGILPPFGVYAVKVRHEDGEYPGAVNIGLSPTFGYDDVIEPRIEVHILGFKGDIYGRKLEIEFMEYLREERNFTCIEALRAQIDKDINIIRKLFKSGGKA